MLGCQCCTSVTAPWPVLSLQGRETAALCPDGEACCVAGGAAAAEALCGGVSMIWLWGASTAAAPNAVDVRRLMFHAGGVNSGLSPGPLKGFQRGDACMAPPIRPKSCGQCM